MAAQGDGQLRLSDLLDVTHGRIADALPSAVEKNVG
jgi:hypothetical protein